MRWHQCLFQQVSGVACFSSTWGVHTDFDSTKGNHGTIDFVDNTIDFLQIVRVGDDLITSENILDRSAMSAFVQIVQWYYQMKTVPVR